MKMTPLLRGIIVGGVFVAIMTLLFDITSLDVTITSFFYDATGTNHFPIGSIEPWAWFNAIGDKVFLYITIGVGLFFLMAGVIKRRLRPFIVYAVFVFLCLAIGAGLIVNVLLKGMDFGTFYIGWSRPRPWDTILFGGSYPFYHVWQPAFLDGLHIPDSSFPSGHVTSGSDFIAFFFVFNNVDFIAGMFGEKTPKRLRIIRAIKYSWVVLALVLGIMLAVARISIGAHYASDCMYSFVFTWLPAAALYYWVFNIPRLERRAMEKIKH